MYGVAAQVLMNMGVGLEMLREEVLNLLGLKAAPDEKIAKPGAQPETEILHLPEPARAIVAESSMVAVVSDEARDLYGADLALIRPDQIVAWRGNSTSGAANVLRRAAGHI